MGFEIELNEETRCDFLVTVERKKIWARLMEMLEVVDGICKKHGIPYYADWGTMLGAVRHAGFIPWDDDLDVMMFRKDYDRFCRIAEKEVKGKFFFQTTLTDKNYYKQHARIRNSETTGICERYEGHGCNNGMYLDILPLENYSYSLRGRLHSKLCRSLGRLLSLKVHYVTEVDPPLKLRIPYWFTKLLNVKRTHIFREKLESRNAERKTQYVTEEDIFPPRNAQRRYIYDIEDFKETVYLPFENTKVPVPAGYDRILKKDYGDYMKFPPVETRGKFHSFICDPDTPYEIYIKEHFGDRRP